MNQKNNELLINSFLDAAVSPIPENKLERRLNRMVAQFFYLGVIDFLRQTENLGDREFHVLIAKTFDRYGIPLDMPVQQYLAKSHNDRSYYAYELQPLEIPHCALSVPMRISKNKKGS